MAREMTAPQSSSESKGRVLVVDDELDIREGLELLLTTEGYSVDQAQNGTEGLRRIEDHSYDLVLLDLMMPDRSGMEVLEEVRQRLARMNKPELLNPADEIARVSCIPRMVCLKT